MNSDTVTALHRINGDFYERHSEAFGATRSHPWHGWDRALKPFLVESSADDRSVSAMSILDVGCGNGRFAEFLADRSEARLRYFGVDASDRMVQQARNRLARVGGIESEIHTAELTDGSLGKALGDRSFSAIVVFGVLHHIAGLATRRALLEELRRRLSPGGWLVLSFWQFGRQQRFRQRILDWREHNRQSADEVDLSQLERGDYLLAWGDQHQGVSANAGASSLRRYCHYADETEAEGLVQSLDLTLVDRFLSDGRSGDLNLYFIVQSEI